MSVKISHFISLCPSTVQFSSFQLFSHIQLFAIPWTAAHQASLYITNSQTLLKLTSIKLVMPSNHLILCLQLLFPFSIFPSIRVFLMSQFFSSGGQSIGVPASALFLPVNIQDWFSLGWTGCIFLQSLKSLHQHHSSKALILHCSAFFLVQLSHPYMTTGKTIALTRWTFVGNIMSLLFNMLSRLVVAFLPRSPWKAVCRPQITDAVILKPKKIKSFTLSMFPHLFAMKWWDQMPWS